ncbi:MAG: class I SAM-dependent methyltransferase [Gemmatimonadaceae bacterium]
MHSVLFPKLYDMFMVRVERGPLGRWRERVVAAAQGRVLEIGAGTGLNFSHYRPDTWVVATDLDVGMLKRARPRAAESAANIVFVAADAEALPFDDAAFTESVVGLTMCTIPHPERALAELRRTVQPGGWLRLLEHVRFDSLVLGRLQDGLTPLWRRVAGGCHLNRRTVETIARSGFALESVIQHLGGCVREIVARSPGRVP